MAYVDFAYYKDTFMGAMVDEADFPVVAERASAYIDYLTRGKATETDAVKKACCAVAEVYDAYRKAREASGGGDLASQTVGSYSVSYRSGDEMKAACDKEMHQIARLYLCNTGLLYRGGRGC